MRCFGRMDMNYRNSVAPICNSRISNKNALFRSHGYELPKFRRTDMQ